ncbi:GGDEF domain-containing protein [Bowmanella dokdonensis]|uniref:diguanylate cyclase n=1 Tax=Bowmanella dokdonensis TaxID=751969 RepID=A0A939DMA0_9ALTE|nr:GGDEF domain-containing protein [Bowmanella dokdonensis]MBN7824862.1 GGDEF domain-containing protein [Bowmanella dokdonensis]
MEQLTSIHDSTSVDGVFHFTATDQLLREGEMLELMKKLLTTLDTQELLRQYLNEVRERIPLAGVEVHWQQGNVLVGTQAAHSRKFHCQWDSNLEAVVAYQFDSLPAPSELKLVQELQDLFSLGLRNCLTHGQLKRLANKDHLTGLGNRASFDEALLRQISHAKRRAEKRFGLLVIDMDRFKAINDRFGHQEGDRVLVAAAESIAGCLRDTDFAFRFGGDEFCCLIEDADQQILLTIAQRIHRALATQPLLAKHQVSCSIGTSQYQDGDEHFNLFERADGNLYRVKQAGYRQMRTA